jgi:hypothetical protein
MILPDQLGVLLALVGGGLAVKALRAAPSMERGSLIASGVLIGLAASVKEPYVFVPAILGIWTLMEIRPLKPGIMRVMLVGCVALMTFALELPFFRAWTGDPMYRGHAIQSVYGAGGLITEETTMGWGDLVYYPKSVFFNPAVNGLFGWLTLIAVARSLPQMREARFIVLWSVVFFVYLQWGSTTLARYQPLPMQPRYSQPMIILLFLPLGRWLLDLAKSPSFGTIGTVVLLAGVTLQGVLVAQESSARGLYSADLPRAIERTFALQAEGAVGRVALPEEVSERLPPYLVTRTESWPKVSMKADPDDWKTHSDEMPLIVLVPHHMAIMSQTRAHYPRVTSWLGQHARVIPVDEGRTFLDRAFLASGVEVLQRQAVRVIIAGLYVLERRP